ncbi:MAG: ABC transporter permease [Anaerolineae bacterium]|nr:ABC transporter permease [Anaerolineae bacterium]
MIFALLRKDLGLYFSNRFFAFITVLGLVFYAGMYFVMPDELDETVEMAIYADELPPILDTEMEDSGIILREMVSAEALKAAVASGEQEVGVVLPEGFARNVAAGQQETVQIYFSSAFPEEFKELYATFFREIGFMLTGQPLTIDVEEQILGEDRAGEQIPYRDRMLPLFAVLILMMETMGLASLVSSEISGGTIEALLVTPLRVEGLFTAKAVFGVGLAFVQAAFLVAVTGALDEQPLLILLLLLLGSVLVTGVAFLIASVASDMMSVMGWGIVGVLVMSLPAFSVLVPGLTTEWVKVIPTYYLVDGVYRVVNHGAGWADMSQNLLALLLFSVVFLVLGIVVLRRRFQ